MRLKILIGFLVALTAAAIAVAAVAAYRFFLAPKHDDAIALVPRDSVGYFSLFLSPSTQQKMAIEDLLAKTPMENFDEAGERLRSLFDDGLEASGCSFEEDFEPWIGDQVAGFALPPESVGDDFDAALLVAAEDERAARDTYYECNESDVEVREEKVYEGVPYELTTGDDAVAVLEGYLLIGSENAVEAAIDARETGTLEDTQKYRDAFEDLAEDRIAAAYVDLQPIIDAMEEAGMTPQDLEAFRLLYGGIIEEPFTATLSAQPDAIVLEVASGLPESGALIDISATATSKVLGELPADSWGAFGIGDFGGYVQATLDAMSETGLPGTDQEFLEGQVRKETGLDLQNDVLAWMGDSGLFIRGTNLPTVDGGLVIEAKDADAATGAVIVLGQYLAEQGAPISRADFGDARGFSVGIPGVPQSINVVVGEGKAVAAYGDGATESALFAEETLADDEGFADAAQTVGLDFPLSAYLEMQPVVSLLEAAGGTDPTYQQDVKPFLDSVKYVAIGTKVTDEKAIQRLVVGVE